MADDFDPYYHWLAIPPAEQPPNHYRLLALSLFEKNTDVIDRAAEQRAIHLRSMQADEHGALAQRLLDEVAIARACLLSQQKKALYDSGLRATLQAAEKAAASAAGSTEQRTKEGHIIFGDYLLVERIGNAVTGRVFKAQHRTMGRVVALKVLSAQTLRSEERLERFRRKVRILAQLSHLNLVAAYDAGELDGRPYLVMEYVDGDSLSGMSKSSPDTLSAKDVADYIAQAADGLAYAHVKGILHRNVKPSNLLVNRQNIVKIIGLGLARFASGAPVIGTEGDIRLTGPGRLIGTAEYMSPEQAIDCRKIDRRADIYSLGCSLFKILTGRPPYMADSLTKILLAHRSQPIPPLRDVRPDVTPELEAVFRKMVAKNPNDRYASMEEVAMALGDCC